MTFSPSAATIWADGTFSMPIEPYKPDIRKWGAQLENAIDAYSSGAGSIAKSTRALLFADLAHDADVTAWVYADTTTAYNGIYRKTGATGTGSWSLILPLPYSFIVATDLGAGTPNAIQSTTSIPVSSSALVWVTLADTTTDSPVTISFNGDTALTIKTNSGNDPAAGGLAAGMTILGIKAGSTFRILNDQISSAIVAAAEAAATAAAASATLAAGYAAGVHLPAVLAGDERKHLRVKADHSGFELQPDFTVATNSALAALNTTVFSYSWLASNMAPGGYQVKLWTDYSAIAAIDIRTRPATATFGWVAIMKTSRIASPTTPARRCAIRTSAAPIRFGPRTRSSPPMQIRPARRSLRMPTSTMVLALRQFSIRPTSPASLSRMADSYDAIRSRTRHCDFQHDWQKRQGEDHWRRSDRRHHQWIHDDPGVVR
jgi:hypothetical protein